jgi:glycosyltransferase involved in cell wall biosynthesis
MPRCVAFVGPLPPPLNGFSNVCGMMLDILRSRAGVQVFNRAPLPQERMRSQFRQLLVEPLRYSLFCIKQRDSVLYLALSGGAGQLFDLFYLAVARLFRRPMFIHHHSFAYINAPRMMHRLCFALMRRCTHIVLSPDMGSRLAQLYGLDRDKIRVVSNAAFYAAQQVEAAGGGARAAPLRIGYLSNITFEKGFVELFDIFEQLRRGGVAYDARIAGPVAVEARAKFDQLLEGAADVQYFGPLYGAEKRQFFQDLDIFIFPTRYANEAEPLVVFEAMQCGIYVIACDRGAIAEMLGNGAGLTASADEVVAVATARVAQLSADRTALDQARQLALLQAQRIRAAGAKALEELLSYMLGEVGKQRLSDFA